MTREPPPSSLDHIVQPNKFTDPEIQRCVKAIPISSTSHGDVEPQSKRRKTDLSKLLPKVIGLLWKGVGEEPREDLTDYLKILEYVLYLGLGV